MFPAEDITDDVQKHMKHIIPLMTAEQILSHAELIRHARVIAIEYSDALLKNFGKHSRIGQKSVPGAGHRAHSRCTRV